MEDIDIELTDEYCPRCGESLYSQWCWAGCDDGWVDLYEEDPFWWGPGDIQRCDEYHGRGHITWCRSCGYDPVEDGEENKLNETVGS